MQLITRENILNRYKPVANDAHKGTQGHALIVGGSYGKMGSVCLSSKAALKAGCGLVTAYIPQCGYEIMQSSFPEAMVMTDQNADFITSIPTLEVDAIGIGPGLGTNAKTAMALQQFLKDCDKPIVLDADAINIISLHPELLQHIRPATILTPHPKELERLIGKWESETQKLEMTAEFARLHRVVIISKGAPTIIIDGHNAFQNTTGNEALATAGSGDVLTGIITGLLAQGYPSPDAALLGVYLHGLTADIARPETGIQSFIASDIIAYLGKAFLTLENGAQS